MVQPLMWIEAEELASILLSNNKKVLVVDLRDEDYEVGHVINSVNYPSQTLNEEALEKLLNKVVDEGTEMIVFHCHYSQVRGPAFGQKFHNLVEDKLPETSQLQCKVLRGGWGNWHKRYRSEVDVQRYITFL